MARVINTKEVDLLSYWMPLLRKLYEFKQIAIAEEPELRYILEAIDRTLANMFIETADEYGIKRFEDMMGLFPEEGDSLETRRFNVLIKWNDRIPYTDKELYNRLLFLCGSADKFTLEEHYTEYWLKVATHLGVAGAFDAVANLLEDMLPCNLVLDLQNTIEAVKTSPLYLGVVTCTAMRYLITNDIQCEYLGGGVMYYGVGLSKAGTHIITHDIASKVSTETPLNEAVVSSTAMAGLITHDVELEDTTEDTLYAGMGVGVAHTRIITHDLNMSAEISGNSTVASPVNTATVITINQE